jgi:hypothetical protein
MHTLNRIPLSTVLWGYLSEVGLDDSSILVGIKAALVCGNAEILLSVANEDFVQAGSGLATEESLLMWGSKCQWCQEGGGDERVMHFDWWL